MKSKWKIIGAFFTLLLILIGMQAIDTESVAAETGSITYAFEDYEGIHADLYQVAVLTDGSYVLTDAFAEIPNIDLKASTAAETLQQYVMRDSMTPLASGETGEDGTLVFTDLQPGAYLLIGEDFTRDDFDYIQNPIFLSIPYTEAGSKESTFDVVAYAKYRFEEHSEDTGSTVMSVTKVWVGDEDDEELINNRPTRITVQLCSKEDGLYKEVELSAENDWRFEWKNLDPKKTWYVTEKDKSSAYSVSIEKQKDGSYVLVNTYNPPEETTTTTEVVTTTTEETTVSTTEATTTTTTEETTTTTTEETSTETISEEETETETEVHQGSTTTTTEPTTTTTEPPVTTTTETETTTTTETSTTTTTETTTVTTTETTTTKTTLPSKIPQTGQPWWPVGVLLCGGLICLIIGMLLGKKKEKNE